MNNTAAYLVKTQAILFVVFLLSCFYFNRFAVDDFYFIGEIKNSSFIETYKHLHFKWHGRWTSNFALLSFIQLYNVPYFLQLFNLLSFLLLFIVSYQLLKAINSCYCFKLAKPTLLVYSLLFLSVFFFCTQSPSETWFWYTGSVVYLWSIIAILGALKIFFISKPKVVTSIFYFIGLIYIGGANEPLVILSTIVLVYLIAVNIKRKLAIAGVLVLITSFLINYLSQGTIHRDEITPGLGFIDLLLYSGYGTIDFLFFDFNKTFKNGLILAIPIYILGKSFKGKFEWFKPIKHLIMAVLLIGLVCFLNNIIVVFALGSLAPDRALISSSLLIALVIASYSFLLGTHSKSNKTMVYYAPILGIILMIALIIDSVMIHSTYAKAQDERIELLQKENTAIIKVKPLPPSGYLYNTEITNDINNFKNQHLKKGLALESDVVLID